GEIPPVYSTLSRAKEILDKEGPFSKMEINQSTRFQNSLIVCEDLLCQSLVTRHQSLRLAQPTLKQLKSHSKR
ncbi:MAG TPA: hypothetical protein VKO63_00135, partial [Chitinispirillaceae bacterium]|nr:hypothetical protein [Chitinispirillaceae bacterium]